MKRSTRIFNYVIAMTATNTNPTVMIVNFVFHSSTNMTKLIISLGYIVYDVATIAVFIKLPLDLVSYLNTVYKLRLST